MRCPTVKELASGIERGDFGPTLSRHIETCDACGDIVRSLRRETEGLTLSIADLWLREKISCPHKDVLVAWSTKALDDEQASYVDFHLNILQCPGCQATLGESEAAFDKKAPERLKRAHEKAFSSTAIFFKNLKK